VIRSRYAEDQLALAVARGVQQYLILGAGWDTFAYRQPAWAQGIRIFEVDQPASQREKMQRLHDAGIALPPNTTLIPIDFETTSLSAGLQGSPFDFTAPIFIAWLGVMVYLTREAIDAVLRFAAARPHGSEIVLTFSTPPPDPQQPDTLATMVANEGEPWKTFFTEEELAQYLTALGFTTVTIPTPSEIAAWYVGERNDGLSAFQMGNLARATV
jgi:methyltransferase (TIGR00027 family)